MPSPEALLRRSRIRMVPGYTERLTPELLETNSDDQSLELLQRMQQEDAERVARYAPRGDAITKSIAPINPVAGLQALATVKGQVSAPYQQQMNRINAIQQDSDMFAQMRAQAQAALNSAQTTGSTSTGGFQIPTGSDKGSKIVAAAMRYLGTPYSWGAGNAKGPTRGQPTGAYPKQAVNTVGFDCSGLVLYAYAQVGLKMPRVSYGQLKMGSRAALSSLRPGDLVGFGNGHHIGIYIGNGKYIHAPQTGDVVKISKLSGRKDAWGVKIMR